MRFYVNRINKSSIVLALGIGVLIIIFQIIQTITPALLENNVFQDSPYTKWIGIDPFNMASTLFFMVIPLLATIPASNLLRQDLNSGFFYQIKIRRNLRNILFGYGSLAFVMGFLVILLPLLINLLIYFMLLPNVQPDNLLNNNLLVFNQNTLLVTLYYQHPFVHATLSILFASFWGGLFATFTVGISMWIKNSFVVLAAGFFVEITLLILNAFLRLPGMLSYVPSDFIKETSTASNINMTVAIGMTIFGVIISGVLFSIGKRKKIVW